MTIHYQKKRKVGNYSIYHMIRLEALTIVKHINTTYKCNDSKETDLKFYPIKYVSNNDVQVKLNICESSFNFHILWILYPDKIK